MSFISNSMPFHPLLEKKPRAKPATPSSLRKIILADILGFCLRFLLFWVFSGGGEGLKECSRQGAWRGIYNRSGLRKSCPSKYSHRLLLCSHRSSGFLVFSLHNSTSSPNLMPIMEFVGLTTSLTWAVTPGLYYQSFSMRWQSYVGKY